MDEWLVILNPHAGVGKGAKDREIIKGVLSKSGLSFHIVTSDYSRHTIALTSEYIEKGYRKIIIAGGDGTLNEVVNGIYSQASVLPSEIILGMLPVGTGNDWVKTFGIPVDYKKAMNIILRGKVVSQDVGRIIQQSKKGKSIRYFANMTGFGFDAMVAQKANKLKNKGRSGLLVYLNSLLTSYIAYQAIKMQINIDKGDIVTEVFSCSIGIGKFNGGGMMQAPGAIPNNGEFEVTLIEKIGVWTLLKNIKGLFDGSFVHDKHVSTYKANKIKLRSGTLIPCEADGENLGKGNFVVEMLPHSLNVIYGDTSYLSFNED